MIQLESRAPPCEHGGVSLDPSNRENNSDQDREVRIGAALSQDDETEHHLAQFGARVCVLRRMKGSALVPKDLQRAFDGAARAIRNCKHPRIARIRAAGLGGEYLPYSVEEAHLAVPFAELIAAERTVPPWIACRMISEAAEAASALRTFFRRTGDATGPGHNFLSPKRFEVGFDGVTRLVDPLFEFREPRLGADDFGYLAPEIAGLDPADARWLSKESAAVFSLGVMLWELCAGSRLRTVSSRAEAAAPVNFESLEDTLTDYSPEIDGLLKMALCETPEGRFQSLEALAAALRALLDMRIIEVSAFLDRTCKPRLAELVQLRKELVDSGGQRSPSNDSLAIPLSELSTETSPQAPPAVVRRATHVGFPAVRTDSASALLATTPSQSPLPAQSAPPVKPAASDSLRSTSPDLEAERATPVPPPAAPMTPIAHPRTASSDTLVTSAAGRSSPSEDHASSATPVPAPGIAQALQAASAHLSMGPKARPKLDPPKHLFANKAALLGASYSFVEGRGEPESVRPVRRSARAPSPELAKSSRPQAPRFESATAERGTIGRRVDTPTAIASPDLLGQAQASQAPSARERPDSDQPTRISRVPAEFLLPRAGIPREAMEPADGMVATGPEEQVSPALQEAAQEVPAAQEINAPQETAAAFANAAIAQAATEAAVAPNETKEESRAAPGPTATSKKVLAATEPALNLPLFATQPVSVQDTPDTNPADKTESSRAGLFAALALALVAALGYYFWQSQQAQDGTALPSAALPSATALPAPSPSAPIGRRSDPATVVSRAEEVPSAVLSVTATGKPSATASSTAKTAPSASGKPPGGQPTTAGAATPEPGTFLTVICTPQCASVSIAEQPSGASPVVRKRVSPGAYTIGLSWDDPKVTKTITVLAKAGEVTTLRESP
jgi:hypothetical protein